MSKTTISDLLVQAIKLAGAKRVYGIAGDSLNALTEAMHDILHVEAFPWAEFPQVALHSSCSTLRIASMSERRDREFSKPQHLIVLLDPCAARYAVLQTRRALAVRAALGTRRAAKRQGLIHLNQETHDATHPRYRPARQPARCLHGHPSQPPRVPAA